MQQWIRLAIGYCIIGAALWCPITKLVRIWLHDIGWPLFGGEPEDRDLIVPLSMAVAGVAAIVWPLFLLAFAVHAIRARFRRRQIESLNRQFKLPPPSDSEHSDH